MKRTAFCMAAGIVLAAAGMAAGASARVETSDARIIEGEVVGIADGVAVQPAKGDKQTLPLNSITEIVWAEAEAATAKAGQAVVVTALGEELAAEQVLMDKGRLQIASGLLGKLDCAVEAARVLYFPPAGQSAGEVEARWQQMKLPDSPKDRLLIARAGAEPLALDGALMSMSAETVSFQWENEARQVPRKTVLMIRLAPPATEKKFDAKYSAVGRDGSTVRCTSLSMDKGVLALESPTIGKAAVAVAKLAALKFASASTVSLASIEPASVKEHGFFDTTFHYRNGRSASGKPLQLGGKTYTAGLGLHSHCELTWNIEGQYTLLVATVGINDAVRPNGDANVTFLGDGKPLGEPIRLHGKESPQQDVRLKIDGVKSLTVKVDFGKDGLDFADHVDLVNPRLLK